MMAAEEKHYHKSTLPKIGTSIRTNAWNRCASYFRNIKEEIACIR